MNKLPKQVYTKEFPEQAVGLVFDEGLKIPEAANRLSMSKKTLANWMNWSRSGKLKEIGSNRRPMSELEMQNTRLRRELAEAKTERDLLKKVRTLPCQGDVPHPLPKLVIDFEENGRCPIS